LEAVKPKILVAPLNWGLGHATRCIPIIEALIDNHFDPIIASDGVALHILQKEFPELFFLELPSYQIEYAKKGAFFKWKLIKNENIASFVNGFILSAAIIALALSIMFKVDAELTFKNENAELYKDFYFFILAPIPFFSALSWFTFKPIFIRK
jgi:UDP:flavonoid glycosyltransferase YjiC (YdhE family)